MAGNRDTPDERRRRDEALAPPADDDDPAVDGDGDVEVLTFRSPLGSGERNALVASAMRVRIDDRRTLSGLRRRRQAWQSEAWDYYDEVPEVGFTVTYLGNIMSKVRLFAATRPDPAQSPVPVDDENSGVDPTTAKIAMETLARLRSPQGGQSALLREMSINFEIAGEALDVDTLVATPTGFSRIGDLVPGDQVLGGDGRPCNVVVSHPIRDDRDCYEVRLSGDLRVVADAEHLWVTHPQRDRQYARQWGRTYEPTISTTVDLAASLRSDAGSGTAANHAIELAAIDGTDGPLPIDPYVLGYWLGDGTASQGNITVHPDDQPHLREQVEAAGFGWSPRNAASGRGFQIGILGLVKPLRLAGLLRNKHIPAEYLRHTEQTRWALLQGLIDSDGHIDRLGRVEFSNTNTVLLWNVVELAASLGLRPSRPGLHRVWFNSAGKPVARLPRKAERIVPAKERDRWRYVQDVQQVKSRPVRCITVDSADGTFLVTEHFIRTHNCYLHGHEDPDTGDEDWQIRSVDELVPDGDWFGLRTGLGSRTLEPVADDDIIIRLWERHPRFSMLATCSMRRILADCESLLLLSREIRATAKSRLSNGFLLKPSELSFGAMNPTQDPSDGEGTNDPFDDDLNETMITAIQDEGSAAAIVPITVTGPAQYLKEFRHVPIARPVDAALDRRIEMLVMRIARGLNMPVEVTTGLQETTFANAAQVKQSEFDAHIEPRCTMECDAVTAGYFQPALEEAGIAHEEAQRIFVWFDPGAAVVAPDPSDNAEKAHEDGVISDEARRKYQGYAESDAPTDDELLRRILLKATRLDPNVLAQLLVITGLAPGIVVPPAAGTTAIDATAAVVASARLSDPRSLGRRLMEIDRDLRTRTQVAADAALRRALERAGNRIRTSVQRDRSGETSALRRVADSTPSHLVASALGRQMVAAAGLTDGDLLDGQFDEVADEFASRATSARRRALAAVAAVYGPLDPATAAEIDTQGDAATATARDWLVGALAALAASRLYAAETTSTAKGETAAGVPVGVARAAVAIAGGAQVAVSAGPGEMNAVRTVGGAPVGGVATGPLVLDAAGPVEAWEWDYGTADRAPFEPHLDVDGLVFTAWNDPELMNVDGWPDAFVAPGDHDGCFPAGTVVSGPPVRGATLRYHKGEVVTVGFASGKLLTATPNHPVLTDRGWVAAGLLDEGDRVVRCADGQRVAGLVPDDEQVPACIEDVAAAFGVRPGVVARRVEVAPMNFHGDGVGSKVAVVWTDGDLGDRGISAASEVGGEASLACAHPVLRVGLPGDSGGTTLLERVGDAPLGVVGGAGPLDPLLGRDGGGVQSATLGHPAMGLARVEENLLDVPAGHAEADGDVVLGLATPIGVDDGVGWRFGNEASGGGLLTGERVRLGAATEHTALGEYLPQERRGDTESAGGGFGSLPFEVRLDRVVHVEKRRFEGHVYNLQTEGHWYVADGVVVHNCACDVIPILVGPGGDTAVDTGDTGDGA